MPGLLSRVNQWLRQFGAAASLAPGRARQTGPLPWAAASAAFAWSLYGRLRAPGRNLCVSPFSVHAVLAMAMAGARGTTLQEMRETLHHPGDEDVDGTIGRLCRDLVIGANGVDLRLANALWDCAAAPSWRRRPPPVPLFRADRPFLFIIRHRETSTILFMGRVADPTTTD